MQTMYTDLNGLIERITADSNAAQDKIIRTTNIETKVKFSTEAQQNKLLLRVDGSVFVASDHTVNQLSSHLDIPTKYMHRMIAEKPALATENFNRWIDTAPEQDKRLIRVDGRTNIARALLSNSYKRIDNTEVVDCILRALDAASVKVEVKAANVTDNRMYLSLVFPKLTTEVGLNDIVQFGIVIKNSEIGKGAFTIEPMVYRLVCLNGMIAGRAMRDFVYRATHLGKRVDEITSDHTRTMERQLILSRVTDYVSDIIKPEGIMQLSETMKQANSTTVSQSPVDTVELLGKSFDLKESELKAIVASFIDGDRSNGGDTALNQWGMVNAVTAISNNADIVPSFDRQAELQAMGGDILNLTANQWDKLATAA